MKRRAPSFYAFAAAILAHALLIVLLPAPGSKPLCPMVMLVQLVSPRALSALPAAAVAEAAEPQRIAAPRKDPPPVAPLPPQPPRSTPPPAAAPQATEQPVQDSPPADGNGAAAADTGGRDRTASGTGAAGGISGGKGKLPASGAPAPLTPPPPAAAPPAPAPPPEPEAPPAGPAIDLGALRKEYARKVRSAILGRQYLPEIARRLGHSGQVKVSLSIGADGSLLSVSVSGSSGYDELDSAALDAVRQAAPFAAPPQEIAGDSINATIRLKYVLD